MNKRRDEKSIGNKNIENKILVEQSKNKRGEVPVLNIKTDGVVNLVDYILATEISHDQALQRANDACRKIALDSGLTRLYTITIPSGKYIINQEVKISPYVKLKSEGYVGFSVTFNGTAFYISPDVNDPKYDNTSPDHLNKNSWNRGVYFDGSIGGFIFTTTLDNELPISKTIAIEIGSRDPSSDSRTPVSRYVLDNVNVYGFEKAFKFNAVNNYIGTLKHCHLELNNHAIYFKSPNDTQINSGENMVFDNCIIAISKKEAVLIDVPGHDITFHNTSFDFNSSPIFRSVRSGTCIRLNNCYIEKIGDGLGEQLIYSSESTLVGETNGRNSFYIKNTPIAMQRPTKLFKNLPNSSGGYINLHLDIDGLELRYGDTNIVSPYDIENRFLVNSPKVYLYQKKIINMTITRSMLSKEVNLLSNGNFERSILDKDLLIPTADPYWVVTYRSGISNPLIKQEGVGASKCLKYTTTNTVNTINLEHKFMYNVEASETLLMSNLFKTDKVSTRTEIIYRLECYDISNTLIQTLNYYDKLSQSTPVLDVEDTNFRLTRSVGSFYIPFGVIKIKPVLIVNNVDGSFFCIDDIHLEKSK